MICCNLSIDKMVDLYLKWSSNIRPLKYSISLNHLSKFQSQFFNQTLQTRALPQNQKKIPLLQVNCVLFEHQFSDKYAHFFGSCLGVSFFSTKESTLQLLSSINFESPMDDKLVLGEA